MFWWGINEQLPIDVQSVYIRQSRKVMAGGNLEPVPDNNIFIHYLTESLEDNNKKYLLVGDPYKSFYKTVKSNTGNTPI